MSEPHLYGIVGEFPTPRDAAAAADELRAAGLRQIDAYTPYPVHGTSEALNLPKSRVS